MTTIQSIDPELAAQMTTTIVASFVGRQEVRADEVPALISSIHASLIGLGKPAPVAEPELQPAVAIRSSVKPDYIVCLEDGKKLKMLKRYLRTHFNMTPDEYRAKWNLPRDYPMVAPAYADQRRNLAMQIGLGRKPAKAAPSSRKVA